MAISPRPSNVDRSLLQAPNDTFSLEEDDLAQQETQQVDFEIEEDEEGGVEIKFGEDETPMGGEPENFFDNIVDNLSEDSLNEISDYIINSVEEDRNSRSEWEEGYTKGLDLLGLRYEQRSEPFEGATGVIHPMLNEAVTQFQAGAYKEMMPSGGPVRAHIVGTSTPEVEKQAKRVTEYMNYMVMYQMEEYEPEFDQMLYFLGLAGSAFKKVYRDEILGRPVSKFIPAEDLVVPYTATDLRSAERVTHSIKISENELKKQQRNGIYSNVEMKGSASEEADQITDKYNEISGTNSNSYDEEFTLYECHCYLDIEEYTDKDEQGEETGIKLPYIVTVCNDTNDVLSVRRNFMPDDKQKQKIQHFVQYKFTPGLGFYGFGLIHMIGNLSRTATANLRQLIDAGTLSNMPAGFKARGMRIANDSEPLSPGEFRDVDVPGGDLRSVLMPLPYKEPSRTLFELMGFVVSAAQKFVGTSDIGVGDGKQEMPVGTTIALLERGARVINAVHKRLHASMKIELKMLAKQFAQDPVPYPYETGVDQQIKAQDFDQRIDVLPVSDPNIFSMSQRVILAQEQLKLAQAAPEMHNMYESYKRMYEALGVGNIDQILTPKPQAQPKDPGTENQEASDAAIGQGKLTAFPEQNHDAHIAVHQIYMQSQIAKLQPAVLMTLEKHIYEHLALKAKVMVEQEMAQPPMDEAMDPAMAQQAQPDPAAMENKIAEVQAQLMAEYLQGNPPKESDDPLVDIKQQELDLKAQEQQQDAMQDQAKLQLDKQKMQESNAIQRERIQTTEDIAQMRAQIALQRQQQNANGKAGQ